MKKPAVLPALALGLLLCACATTAQRGALTRAYHCFDTGAYRDAISHTDRALNYEASGAAAKAEALFLQARCHEALKETQTAITRYQTIVTDFSATEFAVRAKARLSELQR